MKALDQWLDSQEFFELMQQYRHAPLERQLHVVESFEAVNKAISSKVVWLEAIEGNVYEKGIH